MRGWTVLLVAAMAFAVAAVSLATAQLATDGRVDDPGLPAGERAFRHGLDAAGHLIPRSGGAMMAGGCAYCHGTYGRGLSTPMFVAPAVTYRNLTDPAGMLEADGSHGPTYDDGLIRRAVIRGFDADGEALSRVMPRWRFTDSQWATLLRHLKTLR